MTASEVLDILNQKANKANLAGMARYGINITSTLGVSMPELRKLAKSIKKDHELALQLWETGVHECRILASLIDDPKLVTSKQMDNWVAEFNSWDVCDQVCGNLFDRTEMALSKAAEYSLSKEEYVKRAGFVLMAEHAVHNKTGGDDVFASLFPIIEREAWDDRNFVKKAVNWALRQIGKRNDTLKVLAIESAKSILQQDSRAAKWIAKNALAELEKRT
jgi:3-methyladenine DNA glycosylase AlkD